MGSEPHPRNCAGLLELLKDTTISIGRAYIHVPQNHIEMAKVQRALMFADGSREARAIKESLATANDIVVVLKQRGVPITEPFAGTNVEFLTVAGPTVNFYHECIAEFGDAERIRGVDAAENQYDIWSLLHDDVLSTGLLDTDLPPDPKTSPENDSSVILGTLRNDLKFLFTSDAGVPALQKAAESYDLRKL